MDIHTETTDWRVTEGLTRVGGIDFFVLARSQVNLLKYLTVEYYFPTNTLSIK